ncbi:MAG: metallophosphoesterase [Promethearchaeota archaeon]
MQVSQHSPAFSFIHASDIHLGTGQFYNSKLAGGYLQAFRQILQRAELEQVDFIIFGGDIFTSRDNLPGSFEKVLEMLQNFHS